MSILNKIDHIHINLASPEKILEWSFGEVLEPKTVHYRTNKPEYGGLFCERIFGPTKDYHCSVHCGNYNKDKYRNKVCPKCGVEATHSRVRRERMGHIKLEAPVSHYWYFKGKEKYISLLIDLTPEQLKRIIYCDNRIVLDPGNTPLAFKQILTESEYMETIDEYTPSTNGGFTAETGSGAILKLLKQIDLKELKIEIENRLKETKSKQEMDKLKNRLKAVSSFIGSKNRPEWMILTVLPVLPPELRPMVQIDGGSPASSDLNELYRKVINRNERLKKYKEMNAPEILLENGMRLLQQAVDQLISNAKTTNPATGAGNRPLKSLEEQLKGKQGRFRQNLLGKRVDYSGRSVIVSGPKLKMSQCGIPRKMAIELFRPFVIRDLIEKDKAVNLKNAVNKIVMGHKDAWLSLEEVVKNHPVILNRAPTLHRLSVQAFEIVLIEGNAIELHPLVCSAFNADFDGDQMAVHIPISFEAQLETRVLMMSIENLNYPQNGKSAKSPSQDIILGCYYLTMEKDGCKGEGTYFDNADEVRRAYENKWVDLHSKIILSVKHNPKFEGSNYKYLITTPGKVMFNDTMPDNIVFINDTEIKKIPTGAFSNINEAKDALKREPLRPFDKKFIGELVDYTYDEVGKKETVHMLDSMMTLGFGFAMKGGLTISLFDIEIPHQKQDLIDKAEIKVKEIETLYQYGFITDEYRYKEVIKIWTDSGDELANAAYVQLMSDPDNDIAMMIASGARGSNSQYRQLAASRNLMADPNGKTIETPIKANFSEGLSVFEYFISTHGSRKGMVDTALKTANSGYLTRKMVDVAQDVVVTEDDCGTKRFRIISDIKPRISTMEERIIGRVAQEEVKDTEGNKIVKIGDLITREKASAIAKNKETMKIRTVNTCETENGICSKCYGIDLSTRKMVEKGEAVGIIAAQSIGEPGTQLTMRTFHTGGVAGEGDITQGLPRIEQLLEARKLEDPKDRKSVLSPIDGEVSITEKGMLKEISILDSQGETTVFNIPYGFGLLVKEGQKIHKGEPITNGPISPHELLKLKDMEAVEKYLIEEVQKVYKSQGVTISDKHIEVIVKQMTKRVQIIDEGDSDFVIGHYEEKSKVDKENEKLIKLGEKPSEYMEIVQSIRDSSLTVESFLSAASFERTSKVLAEAAILGKKDKIVGIKESVIVGKMIPSGTGFYTIKNKQRERK